METGGTQRLTFAGALTMRAVDAICSDLRAAIAGAGPVLIDCAGADEVDVSFIQLLIAARRAAQRNGTQLRLAAPPEGALQAALTRAGFIFPGAGGSADGSAAHSAGDHEDIWFAAAQP